MTALLTLRDNVCYIPANLEEVTAALRLHPEAPLLCCFASATSRCKESDRRTCEAVRAYSRVYDV